MCPRYTPVTMVHWKSRKGMIQDSVFRRKITKTPEPVFDIGSISFADPVFQNREVCLRIQIFKLPTISLHLSDNIRGTLNRQFFKIRRTFRLSSQCCTRIRIISSRWNKSFSIMSRWFPRLMFTFAHRPLTLLHIHNPCLVLL